MKKYLFLGFIWCAFASAVAQDSLCMKLDSLLADPMFETTQVGLMVYDLTGDSAVYCRNERQTMRPASCMKLVTAITALDRLGDDYTYKTRIYYTGRLQGRTLVGNVYCVGGFDPSLTIDDVAMLAGSVQQLGIDSIRGNLVADCTMKEADDYGEGWCWDDENPMLTPLTIGRKSTFMDIFTEELARAGINLEGISIQEDRTPVNAHLVATCEHNIVQVMEHMMKDSDNFYAESMFYQTAASANSGLARAKDARSITRRLINKLGLTPEAYRIADGSGLSLYNYVSAELLCTLLRYAWNTPVIRNALVPTLPIAGVDGTLEKRMRRTKAQGNVKAKTGTVSGISSLAGYCTTADGRDLCFVIINQGVMRQSMGRNFQDRVCVALCEP